MVGLTRGQGGAGVGVLPLRARGCLRFGGMGFGRFGRGVGRGISCPVWRGPPPRTREPPDVLVAHQSRTGPPRPLRGRPGGRPVRGRITPAFAGTTMLADTTFCVYAEHPRPRGDHDFTVFNPAAEPEHPRPRGDHLLDLHLQAAFAISLLITFLLLLKPPTYAPPFRHASQRANPPPAAHPLTPTTAAPSPQPPPPPVSPPPTSGKSAPNGSSP